ncbi:glycosyltransferase family 4 protein [Paenibacillus sp. TRM 82003]|uniref:glycosyltransferase family 4 protein n=1 Tax=Kineococcus sp. TRM81007 TaxID=2925831 RepID=UPI001F591F76|nr:glycosyltransferase family 4 protein [Kineococcus sp. TRM81007]MCI2240731.1 glycosyltransferase family 4 protein [Kineococcus sp. TRM81007]MCI3925345.1 glycosyltransferase family 4 protein [Paenibacillus sp. TRM 82003]
MAGSGDGAVGAGGEPVVLVLGTSAGGVGRHVAQLCEGLRERGAAVHVAAPAATLQRFRFAAATAPVDIGASLDPVRDLRAAARLRRALRAPSVRGAVVHAHGVRAALVAALAVRSLRPRPALVVTLHNAVLGTGPRARLGRAVQDAVARAADVVLAVSGDLVGQARSAGARRVRRALVPAPPLPAGAPVLPPGDPVVLVVARLAPQKGLDVLLDAAGLLRHPARVLVAGDGPLREALAARVAAERLPVRLLGERGDVPGLLASADVAVSASAWEGQPVFVQEALRAGVPVVATDAGGTAEVTGDAADLVPVGDAVALAAAVDALLADPALREERSARARRRAAGLPGAEDALAQVLGEHAAARCAAGGRRRDGGTSDVG